MSKTFRYDSKNEKWRKAKQQKFRPSPHAPKFKHRLDQQDDSVIDYITENNLQETSSSLP